MHRSYTVQLHKQGQSIKSLLIEAGSVGQAKRLTHQQHSQLFTDGWHIVGVWPYATTPPQQAQK